MQPCVCTRRLRQREKLRTEAAECKLVSDFANIRKDESYFPSGAAPEHLGLGSCEGVLRAHFLKRIIWSDAISIRLVRRRSAIRKISTLTFALLLSSGSISALAKDGGIPAPESVSSAIHSGRRTSLLSSIASAGLVEHCDGPAIVRATSVDDRGRRGRLTSPDASQMLPNSNLLGSNSDQDLS